MRSLILASTSPYRKALLEQLGIDFVAVAPRFVEEDSSGLNPEEMAAAFAKGKAESLRQEYPEGWILGSDQVPALGTMILRKPNNSEEAVEQLLKLSGQTHHLITAVALLDATTGEWFEQKLIHQMEMRTISRTQAIHYVQKDNPVGCAGAYRIEANGPALFKRMEGLDHTAIIGLPLSVVGNLLEEAGAGWLNRVCRTVVPAT